MEKMELYHIHANNNHDRMWHEKAVINIKETFKNKLYERYNGFTTAIPIEDVGNVNLYDLILQVCHMGKIDEQLTNELIQYAYKVSYYASCFKRETAMENYRKDKGYKYPSRLHSVYLTDEAGIDAWMQKLGKQDLQLFRVLVEGNIFKTNEIFIPDETLPYSVAYSDSYHYWNPNFRIAPKDSNEYLVQGKIKILEKIK